MVLGQIQKQLDPIFHELTRQKECLILEGHLMPDHYDSHNTCICALRFLQNFRVSSIIGFLKGKSAIAIARELGGELRNFTGEHFWARGYVASTVGFELEQIHIYIRDKEPNDGQGRFRTIAPPCPIFHFQHKSLLVPPQTLPHAGAEYNQRQTGEQHG